MLVFRTGQKHMIALRVWRISIVSFGGRVSPPLFFSSIPFCLEDLVSRCSTKAVFCLVLVLVLLGVPMAAVIPPGGTECADESEARSGVYGRGQAGQSAKLTERSEVCACAGVGLVGEADIKRPPHRAERIAKL